MMIYIPLNKQLNFLSLTVIIRNIFEKNGKYYLKRRNFGGSVDPSNSEQFGGIYFRGSREKFNLAGINFGGSGKKLYLTGINFGRFPE